MGNRVRFSVFTLLLALLLSISPVSAKTTVTFWHAMSGPLGQTIDRMVAEFNASHPEIEVKAEYQGNYGQLQQKLIASLAARQPPVIAQSYTNWTEQFIRSRALVPMQQFLNGPDGMSQAEFNDIFRVFREQNTWDGVLWSLPFNKSIYVYLFNQTLYDEVGVAVPESWQDLLRAAQATTKVQDGEVVRYGYGMRPNVDTFSIFLLTAGGQWLDPAYKEARFNGAEGVEALQFLVDMLHRYKVAYYIPGYLEQDFAAGKVAGYATTVAGRPFAEGAVGDRFQWGVAPVSTYRSRQTPIAGTDLVIFAQATPEQQRAAWIFAKWLTNTENTARWSMETYYLPVRQSAVSSPAYQEYIRSDPRNGAAVVLLPYATYEPGIEEWFKIRNYLSDAVEKAFLQQATPQAALDEAAQKANRDLARRR